jgi:hypothetical protein
LAEEDGRGGVNNHKRAYQCMYAAAIENQFPVRLVFLAEIAEEGSGIH